MALISVMPRGPGALRPVNPVTDRGRSNETRPVTIVPMAAMIFSICNTISWLLPFLSLQIQDLA
jgi:hypothetical protein